MSAPTDPKTLTELKAMIAEITHCYHRIDSEREQVKEIVAAASEAHGIEKKMINKIARTMYKHDYANIMEENANFELLYESIVGAPAGKDD